MSTRRYAFHHTRNNTRTSVTRKLCAVWLIRTFNKIYDRKLISPISESRMVTREQALMNNKIEIESRISDHRKSWNVVSRIASES